MNSKLIIPLFFVFTILITNITTVNAVLPEYQSYRISSLTPFAEDGVEIEVTLNFVLPEPYGDISGTVGSFSITLYWSRDRSTWVGESMSLVAGNYLYKVSIPPQDGSDYTIYDYGEGTFYWYVVMENDANEEEFLFSEANPNSEIYFLDPYASSTDTYIEEIPSDTKNPIGEAIVDMFEVWVGEDVASNPLFQLIVLLIAFIIIAVLIIGSINPRFLRTIIGGIYGRK